MATDTQVACMQLDVCPRVVYGDGGVLAPWGVAPLLLSPLLLLSWLLLLLLSRPLLLPGAAVVSVQPACAAGVCSQLVGLSVC